MKTSFGATPGHTRKISVNLMSPQKANKLAPERRMRPTPSASVLSTQSPKIHSSSKSQTPLATPKTYKKKLSSVEQQIATFRERNQQVASQLKLSPPRKNDVSPHIRITMVPTNQNSNDSANRTGIREMLKGINDPDRFKNHYYQPKRTSDSKSRYSHLQSSRN